MEKVIDEMIGSQLEEHRRKEKECSSGAGKERTNNAKPLMPQIKATVSPLLSVFG